MKSKKSKNKNKRKVWVIGSPVAFSSSRPSRPRAVSQHRTTSEWTVNKGRGTTRGWVDGYVKASEALTALGKWATVLHTPYILPSARYLGAWGGYTECRYGAVMHGWRKELA